MWYDSIINFFKALVLRYNAEMPKTMKTVKWLAGAIVVILGITLAQLDPTVLATVLLPAWINNITVTFPGFILTWGNLITSAIFFFTGIFGLTAFTATNPTKNVAANLPLPLKEGITNVRANKQAGV